MSGFGGGGGFGSSQPQPFGGSGGFGAPPQQNQQQPQPQQAGFFNNAAPSAFGAAPAASFGTSAPVAPFGAPTAQPPQPSAAATFGSPPSMSFGTTATTPQQQQPMGGNFAFGVTNPFGTPPAATSQPPTMFGTATPQAPAFGMASSATSASTPAPFGTTATSMAPPPPSNPFGGPTSGFGGGGASNTTSHAFGGGGFGNPQPPPAPSAVPNPFGMSHAASAAPMAASSSSAPMMSFGVSSNVANDSDMMQPSSGSNSPIPNWNSSNQGTVGRTNQNNHNLFSPGFPVPEEEKNKKKPLTNLPFGTPVNNNSAMGTTSSAWPAASSTAAPNPFQSANASSHNTGTISPIMTDSGSSFPPFANKSSEDATSESNEKLAKLKAKLAEKKKRLQEKKQNEAHQQQQGSQSPGRPHQNRSLDPNATSFVPGGNNSNNNQSDRAEEDTSGGNSLAERNALRFATGAANQATRSHLPSDLQNETATDYSALRQSHTNAQNLDSAKSLVGTCPHMCPDEELLRREREGDIQLLELVKPGELHPANWSLRNTAVKRFRRSAADYKLDVPEWIRPPHVLEQVCSYLEEWVMERDRQGPDIRFQSGTPPSLDVYQFIWDRTRMVRKDFILQNYVGTGGKCDAHAVRCHERIARWHAMCEHQLSHIDDFCVMQSQQNIQELGQTMKTLNQYYDDTLKRSTMEEPDEEGKDRASKNAAPDSLAHGCQSNTVQGNPPTDFDGTPLKNTADDPTALSRRGIGKANQDGTAEPEMSGLYILLTIDNDGGMEVMRYVAHLSRVRPHIYSSKPVQLALDIYKAKKEYNYSRFFKILRSPATPYLFACIMFKHVALMRKTAFQIMSKTYGGKSKDTNEAIYDAYPLKNLVRLLCFEDEDEARAACRHFNIAVTPTKVRTSSGHRTEDIVFWRKTNFSEPKDEDKGTVVPLRPRKMMKTIESKLEGATRLAVCRGEKSGEGSFTADSGLAAKQTPESLEQARRLEELRREEDARRFAKAQELMARERVEKKRQEDELAKQQAFQMEKERQKEEELQKIEEKKKQEAQRIAAEQEAARQKAEEEERLRQQHLEEQRRKEKELMERKRLEEEERNRKEQERLLKEKRKREEAERLELERQRKIAEEKRRIEEQQKAEARRLELERQRIERERREEQERKETAEWNKRVEDAQARLSFHRWMYKFPTHLRLLDETRDKLKNLGRTTLGVDVKSAFHTSKAPPKRYTGLRSIIEALLRQENIQTNIALNRFSPNKPVETVQILKLAVVFPTTEDHRTLKFFSLIQTWLARTLDFGHVHHQASLHGNARVVFVDGNIPGSAVESSDGMLVVVPCQAGSQPVDLAKSLQPLLVKDIPRVALVLLEEAEDDDLEKLSKDMERYLSDSSNEMFTVTNSALDGESICNSLVASVDCLAQELAKKTPRYVERILVEDLCTRCITNAIWSGDYDRRDDLVDRAREVLSTLVDELSLLMDRSKDEYNHWPSTEFANESNSRVLNYFAEDKNAETDAHLPLHWAEYALQKNIECQIFPWADRLEGSLTDVMARLLIGAPDNVLEECRFWMEDRSFRRALQSALVWKSQTTEPWEDLYYVFVPGGSLSNLVQQVSQKATARLAPPPLLLGEAFVDRTPAEPPRVNTRVLALAHPRTPASSAMSSKRRRPAHRLSFDHTINVIQDQRDDIDQSNDTYEEVSFPPLESGHAALSKKRRLSAPVTLHRTEVSESEAFTRRLQAMMTGDELVHNQVIGGTTLSSLLSKAPKPSLSDI